MNILSEGDPNKCLFLDNSLEVVISYEFLLVVNLLDGYLMKDLPQVAVMSCYNFIKIMWMVVTTSQASILCDSFVSCNKAGGYLFIP